MKKEGILLFRADFFLRWLFTHTQFQGKPAASATDGPPQHAGPDDGCSRSSRSNKVKYSLSSTGEIPTNYPAPCWEKDRWFLQLNFTMTPRLESDSHCPARRLHHFTGCCDIYVEGKQFPTSRIEFAWPTRKTLAQPHHHGPAHGIRQTVFIVVEKWDIPASFAIAGDTTMTQAVAIAGGVSHEG